MIVQKFNTPTMIINKNPKTLQKNNTAKDIVCYNNNMEVREYNKNDEEQIKDLLVELQKYVIEIDKYNLNILSPDYREKYFKFMVDDCYLGQGKIFVASDSGVILGIIAGYVQNYDERDKLDYACPKKGIVTELIVNKKCRTTGIGSSLLKTIENYFKSIKCEYVQIDVFAYNEIARKFYNNHNYNDRMITMFKSIKWLQFYTVLGSSK